MAAWASSSSSSSNAKRGRWQSAGWQEDPSEDEKWQHSGWQHQQQWRNNNDSKKQWWDSGSWRDSGRESWRQQDVARYSKKAAWHQESQGSWRQEEQRIPWYIDVHDLILHPPNHQFTIVVLHSCSGGPEDIIPYIHHCLPSLRQMTRIVAPASPLHTDDWDRTLNSWFEYDDASEDGNSVKDATQLLAQSERIVQLLADERDRLPGKDASRLMLWGLSQGVALALHAALRTPFAIGGILALRGMALKESESDLLPWQQDWQHKRDLEVFAFNGGRDRMCPQDKARASYDALSRFGVRTDYGTDPYLAHACAHGRQHFSSKEFSEVASWLQRKWDGKVQESMTL
mmetsp:Transcript_62758/g.149745  ORF Transcript_62758/g.149745 Transcript_62758/m.149745 type:complete len:344 (-) Transcript_62758:95-1126(-)